MRGPLQGVRILEVGHMLAGPYCGLLLADLGADVIKVEPQEGDIARRVSPNFIGPHNEYFASLNRNKRSVRLDLATPEGQASLRHLASTSQGLITNLRPSAIRKHGLTYEALRTVNPDVVCVAITGFGLTGPYVDRPAYDYIIQAMTGVMEITGEPDAPPTKTGYSAVDNSAGTMAAFALCAKLVEGSGGQIDIAMYDVMLSQLNYIASSSLNSGVKAQRFARSAHPYMVPAQLFETHDGWLTIFITHDKFWALFAKEVGRRDWLDDPRFATMEARRENRELVLGEISAELLADDAKSWVRRLAPQGVVAACVASLEDALASDQTAVRDMVLTYGPVGRALKLIGNPVKMEGYDQPRDPPPLLGEHQFLVEDRLP
jgi:CoA:oxalate CoA-transferase